MTFEASLSITKLTNSLRFRHPCHICGYQHAAFGVGCDLRAFMELHAKNGTIDKVKLGIWTCGMDGCVNKAGAVNA
jgi:hypothetical protein